MSEGPRNWRAALAAIALLLIGAALGIAVDRVYHRSVAREATRLPPTRGTGITASIEFLDSALVLRPEQRRRIEAILARRQGPIDSIWSRTHRSLLSSLDSTVAEMGLLLDAGQRARLDSLLGDLRNPAPRPHEGQ